MDKVLDFEHPDDSRPKVETCKGLFFRGYKNLYHQGSEVHLKQGFRLLKTKSCKGCPKCDHFSGEMADSLDCNSVIIPKEIKHGGLYSIRVTNIETDWETNCVDAYDFEFYEVKP